MTVLVPRGGVLRAWVLLFPTLALGQWSTGMVEQPKFTSVQFLRHKAPEPGMAFVDFLKDEPSLRDVELERCVTLGEGLPGRDPVRLEWTLNSTLLTARLIVQEVRSGNAAHNGYVGFAFKGDGASEATTHENLFFGYPVADSACTSQLYMNDNLTSSFHGYCVFDNDTLAVTNCSTKYAHSLNGTCRLDNASIPYQCHCYCDFKHGCWGPSPAKPNSIEGCSECREHFGGYKCRIPVQQDLYQPDGANAVIRLAWRRHLKLYPHTYGTTIGNPTSIDVLWAYRYASLFSSDCSDRFKADPTLRDFVKEDTERMRINLDLANPMYDRIPGKSCLKAPLSYIGVSPLRHVKPETNTQTLRYDWIKDMLHLGSGTADRILVQPTQTIDDIVISRDGNLRPEPGQTDASYKWSLVAKHDGVWSNGTYDNFVQLYALAIHSEAAQQTIIYYQVNQKLRVWMDSLLVVQRDTLTTAETASPVFTIGPGWHQFIFKVAGAIGSNMMTIRFSTGNNLKWKQSLGTLGDGVTLTSGLVKKFLMLGNTVDSHLSGISSSLIDLPQALDNGTEIATEPMTGDIVYHENATGLSRSLVWTPMRASDGEWGAGSIDNFVQYYAFALYTKNPQFIFAKYRVQEAVRVWLDGFLWFKRDTWDGNNELSAPSVNISSGWHQVFIKHYGGTGDNYFKLKIKGTNQVKWQYELPMHCHPNPCINGGRCRNSQCVCPSQWGGPFCDQSFLYGERFQNMRILLVYFP